MIQGKNPADVYNDVQVFGAATPSSAAPRYVSLKNAVAVEVVISGKNGSTVTGSAVTLLQADLTNGANSKPLAFAAYKASTDQANSAAWTNSTASSNTFTTVTTNAREFKYRIPIDPASLDRANGFDCLGVGLGNGANTTLSVDVRILPASGGNSAAFPDPYGN